MDNRQATLEQEMMTLTIFEWSEHFATGAPLIDAQHRQLLDICNTLSTRILNGQPEGLNAASAELHAYASKHFADEIVWMRAHGVDPEALKKHGLEHAQFVRQLDQILASDQPPQQKGSDVYAFVASWLIYHILAEDRPIIQSALLPQTGRREGTTAGAPRSGTEAVLLTALNNLYTALTQINAGLEQKVVQRTAELAAANSRLACENEALQTALKQLHVAETRLAHSEKMAVIGTLAAGVAHEINNPLGFVSANFTTLLEYAEALLALVDAGEASEAVCMQHAPELLQPLHQLKEASDLAYMRQDLPALMAETASGLARIQRIIDQMLGYAHVSNNGRAPHNINRILDSSVRMASHRLAETVNVIRDYADLPPVICDPGEISQVFDNLLTNAAHAVGQRRDALPAGQINLTTRQEGAEVAITIADNGTGMSTETRNRVFEPFFTTKAVGDGTGLGLALCWNIIERHQGTIEVDSTLGAGSRFTLRLPLALDARADAPSNTNEPSTP